LRASRSMRASRSRRSDLQLRVDASAQSIELSHTCL
jgi:hypothetical protein